ncbi:putative bifunctional diguanylate cyclase/phosphodiesterase [Glaciecola sp. MF2-115]|uniref:putative bifunctional diguanylate cyclase/phosphodiesterase n=1 Tax=Glaciecola sp. MF2-115 TaxID=3384827 RepID=UPI0039A2717A
MVQKHQSLTTLSNRYHFIDMIEAVAASQPHFSIMLVDVMRFSDVSSAFDHKAGDEILLQIVNRIHEIFGHDLILGRISGDIFGLVFEGRHTEAAMQAKFQHLVEHFKTPLHTNDTAFIADFNVGIASRTKSKLSATKLISLAEAALKQAKNNKHQNYSFVNDNESSVTGRGLALKADLTRALKNNELELYFQPKVNLDTLEIIGAECLLRWNHPLDGVLFPGTLIEAAESYNMMNELGHWTISYALEKAGELNKLGINLPISINLSPSQLYDVSLTRLLTTSIQKYSLQAKMIELELTEDVALSNSLMVKRQLDEIRAMGIMVSMDDFGKGYSNLSFIRDLNLCAIKIDKTFVMELQENPVNKAIVEATKLICDAKNCEVVAEGIETIQQLNILKELGIFSGQGFLFSPAVKFESFIELCKVGDFQQLLLDKIKLSAS